MVGLQRFAFVLPHAARNRQGFGELPPKNARVRADARVLLVILGRKRFQRAEICRFLLCYQDIFVITKHSNACCEPWTRTRAFFWRQIGTTSSKRSCARGIPWAQLRFR